MSIKTERQQASQVIADLEQSAFVNRYWRAIGAFLGKGKPVSIWVSAAVVMGANLLLGVTVSVVLRETQFTSFEAILKSATWVIFSYFTIPLFVGANVRLIEFLRLHLVESIQNEQHLHELLDWLHRWLGKPLSQLLFYIGSSIVISLLGFYAIYPSSAFSIGVTIIYFINFFHLTTGLYGLISLFAFLLKLKLWNLTLYSDDPSSSPILIQLSRELRNYILTMAFGGAGLLLTAGLLGTISLLLIISMLAIVWMPIIALFLLGNHAFSQQITRVKYERLEKLQSRIMKLSNVEKMDKETTAHIMGLMDYHDRVKATRNSLYNTEAFTNLIGSLALPLFAAFLSAIDVWQKFFGKP